VSWRRRWSPNGPLLGVLLGGCLALIPLALPRYPRFVLSLTLVNAIAAMGVNVSMGYAGQVSIGHAGFASVGAYTTAILMGRFGASFWLTLPLGAGLAGLLGFLVGLPALRLNPLYIAMVTFGFGQVISNVSMNWLELTNGPNGLPVPAATIGTYEFSPHSFYFVIAAIFLLLLWVSRNLAGSRLGRCFTAIRESELAAQAMGIHLAKYKTIAFALGALYGGIAGALYASLSEFVNPDAFVFLVSILYLTMNVVGGMGTLMGPVVGAFVFTVMPEVLRPFAEYKELLSGCLLLIFLIFVPQGLVGMTGQVTRRLSLRVERRAAAPSVSTASEQ
jgi:ABC-type branched-subunit amino acid transport system permease subunit